MLWLFTCAKKGQLYINKGTLTSKQKTCPTGSNCVCELGSNSCKQLCMLNIHTCSHQLEGLSTLNNEGYSLRQLDDPVYDEASSTQPNYSSQDLDEEGVKDQVTNSIRCMTKPRREVTYPTPKNENNFHDTQQHTNEVVNANKMKKAQNKSDDRNQQQTNAQETSTNPPPVRNEASKIKKDFYDAEEHTYSVVNNKKKANKKPPEYEGERKDDLQ